MANTLEQLKSQPSYDAVWTEGFPIEPGYYWAYGVFWGGRTVDKPELKLIEVVKSQSLIYICSGTFLFKGDVVGLKHSLAHLPKLPV